MTVTASRLLPTPPQAPGRQERLIDVRIALGAFVLFTAFAGNFWRNLTTWWGWGAIVLLTAVLVVGWLVRRRAELRRSMLPLPLAAFLVWITASIAWSAWRPETALGVVATALTVAAAVALAMLLTLDEFVRALTAAMQWIVGLSLVFELIVAWFVRGPVLPLYLAVDHDANTAPLMWLWSRNRLFDLTAPDPGKIQGIQGNSIELGVAALLLVTVVALRLADASIRKTTGIAWLVIGGAVLLLVRSGTLAIAVAAIAITAVLVVVRRRIDRHRAATRWFGAGLIALLVGGVVAAVTLWPTIVGLLGKSDDLTGRLEYWSTIGGLASEHSATGWGWLGYYPIWVDFFDDLLVRWDTVQLSAHNAWIDLWFQTGIVGAVLVGLTLLAVLVRGWWDATGRPWTGAVAGTARYGDRRAIAMLPLLIGVLLAVQSLAESRLLIEEGLLMLATLAVRLKSRSDERDRMLSAA